jgi:citrate lyase subunit beta/citryl-CoA lyase
MPPAIDTSALFLFVPADRPERYAKAFGSGADAVILDLEDAVAADRKGCARDAMAAAREAIAAAPCPVVVRINPAGTPFHAADIQAVAALGLAGTMLPKTESPDAVTSVAASTGHRVIALVESARGLAAARSIAAVAARLAFGSIDFATDLGCAHTREALLFARSELVFASRLAGRPGPVDGVTTAISDPDLVGSDMAYAVTLGFAGKLLIHPAQVNPARHGLVPSPDEAAWADRVLASGSHDGAVAVDGTMVDAPVRLRAEHIRRRALRMDREPG